MKITKPKMNQILIEDDCLINFDINVKSKTGLSNSEFNEKYEGLVFGYRLPNMEASKQIFYGSQVSIATLLTSMLDSVDERGIVELEMIVDAIKDKRKMFDK